MADHSKSKRHSKSETQSTIQNLNAFGILAPTVWKFSNIFLQFFSQVTQVLVLTVMATLVKYTTNESEVRILYEYLAEASIVFPKVFPVIHSLLVNLNFYSSYSQ